MSATAGFSTGALGLPLTGHALKLCARIGVVITLSRPLPGRHSQGRAQFLRRLVERVHSSSILQAFSEVKPCC